MPIIILKKSLRVDIPTTIDKGAKMIGLPFVMLIALSYT